MYNQVKKTWAKQSVALDVSLLLVIDSIVSKYMTLVFLYLNINLSRDNLVCILAVVTVCGSDRGVHNVFLLCCGRCCPIMLRAPKQRLID